MNNPNFLAFMAALGFGFMLIPWNKTLQNMGNPQFSIIIGLAFIVSGILQQWAWGGRVNLSFGALALGMIGIVFYVGALTSFNFAVAAPAAKLGVVAAITATYPIIGVLAVAIFTGQIPTLREAIFIVISGIGVAGLSLSGKGH